MGPYYYLGITLAYGIRLIVVGSCGPEAVPVVMLELPRTKQNGPCWCSLVALILLSLWVVHEIQPFGNLADMNGHAIIADAHPEPRRHDEGACIISNKRRCSKAFILWGGIWRFPDKPMTPTCNLLLRLEGDPTQTTSGPQGAILTDQITLIGVYCGPYTILEL